MNYLKKISIIFIVLFSSCSSDLSYNEKVRNYNYFVSISDSLIKQKNYRESIKYSEAAIEIFDSISIGFYLKGIAAYNLNKLDDAEDFFSEVIDLDGEYSIAYKDRAKVFLKNNDSDFLDDIDFYLKNHPNDNEALLLKREYFEKNKEYDNSILEYNKAIERNNHDIDLYKKRAELLFRVKDFKESLKDYEHISKIEPENISILKKIEKIKKIIQERHNRLIFALVLIVIYALYFLLSQFVLKPIVLKKAENQIGGKFIVSKDPLILILPIIFLIIFLVLNNKGLIPNF
ncbi:MAG: hypothetical protein GW772_08340 [Flavobacteriia bacterium]|nr:hypothetical protein [Flavobacteriia bacterium]NCT60516.1 hypothetical protein [Flavobacteriia bacterium]